MAELIFEFFIILLEIYTYYGTYRVVLGAKTRNGETMPAVFAVVISALFAYLCCGLHIINLDRASFLAGLFIPFMFKGKTIKWFGLYFPVFGVVTTICSFVYMWLKDVNIYSVTNIVVDHSCRFMCILIVFGILYIIYGIKGDKKTIQLSGMQILLLNSVTASVAVAIGGYDIMYFNGNWRAMHIYVNCVLVMCLICYFLVIYSIYISKKRAQEKYALEHQRDMLNSQKEQINAILENEKLLRACRHDFKTHIYAIDSLAAAGDTESLRKYCADLVEDAKNYSKAIISGNVAVDGILGRAIDQCKAKGIEFKPQISLMKDCKVDDSELCIIFSNIMSNAIEACESGDEIKLVCYPYNDLLCILQRNPIHGKLEYDGDKLVTTKEDKELHGHGIENVKAIISKYDGYIKFNDKDGMFNMEMLI